MKVLQQLVQFVVQVDLVLHVDELVHLIEYINVMAMTSKVVKSSMILFLYTVATGPSDQIFAQIV